MRLIHTSDWHLGRVLCGKKRYEESEAFLSWLVETIRQNDAEVLLVAGDVFDSSAPSNRAQGLYYNFLRRAAASVCRHVVIVAGNHDSPSFLNAPKELLKAMDVHVLGGISEDPEEEVLTLRDGHGNPKLIVCAVPYLRDRDIRLAESGENATDKERKLLEGIRAHYAAVAAIAERKKTESGAAIPIVALGHLFTNGGKSAGQDSERELYVGSLARVAPEIFQESFNYAAFGHLHVPQQVKGFTHIRYSGSPLPLSFGEAGQDKSVCLVEFRDLQPITRLISVPVFQPLERLQGDWPKIDHRLRELVAQGSRAWLEIIYEGGENAGDLRERLRAATNGASVEILRTKNDRLVSGMLEESLAGERLEDLDAEEVFRRCLTAHSVPDEQWPEFLDAYRETLLSLREDDPRAE